MIWECNFKFCYLAVLKLMFETFPDITVFVLYIAPLELEIVTGELHMGGMCKSGTQKCCCIFVNNDTKNTLRNTKPD